MKSRKLLLKFAACYLSRSGAQPPLGGASAGGQAAIVGPHNVQADPLLAVLWRLCSKQALRGRSVRQALSAAPVSFFSSLTAVLLSEAFTDGK